jgi:ATP-dependent helicase/nuclease subunit A
MKLADAVDREVAAGRLDLNVVVEAGAGTGKTTLLIDRISRLLLQGGTPIERLVALTFTEKAAAEIRIRLAKRLHEELDGKADEKKKTLAEAALRSLDRAQIGTIHGFANHLLRLYPLEAGIDPSAVVDEGREGEELFETEWAKWLDVELAEDSPRAEAWLEALRGSELDELAALAKALAEPKVPERLPSSRGAADALEALGKEAARLAESNRKGEKLRKVETALLAAGERLRALANHLRRAPGGSSPADEASLEISGSAPAGWSADDFTRAKALAKLASAADRKAEERVEAAVELLAPFVRRFRSAHERRGYVSFDGLLVRARDLVRSNARVRQELKAAFDAFLIDEFQDTDPLQGELLLYLAEKPGTFASEWSKVKLAPGKLFVVGDPKQSIYRFRGADIAAFERFTELMLAQGAEKARLTVNFRSEPGVLDKVNAVFPHIMKQKAGFQPEYVPLTTRPSASGGSVEVLRFEGAASADELREAEAEAIADWIEKSRLPLKDVAILLRTMTPLRTYLNALKSRGLAYVVEGEKYFYEAPEVRDFFNLLAAIDDPARPVALLGLLRSPLVGLSDAEILELKSKGPLDYRRAVPGRAGKFFELLRELHEQVGRRPVGELVGRILSAPFFLELALRGYDGEQTLANLLKFGAMASEASDEKGLSLKEFRTRLEADVRKLTEEGESPLADESLEAVRLMSMHKSKGLEFPVVVLPNLCADTGGQTDSRPRVDWETGWVGLRLGKSSNAAMAVIEERELGKERDEATRVLYVAMTRPMRRLLLVGSGEPKQGSLAEKLSQAGAWTGESIAYQEPPRRRRESEAAKLEVDGGALKAQMAAREKSRKDGETPLFIAPSAGKKLDNDGDSRPEEARPADAVLVGLVCHRVLEKIDFSKPEPDAEAAAKELALERPAPGWEEAAVEAAAILKGFFRTGAGKALAGAEILARELPFVYGLEGRVVRGAADLVCREGGKLIVVDYKTDRVASAEAKKRAKAYAEQGACYVEAVERVLGEKPEFRVLFLRSGESVSL